MVPSPFFARGEWGAWRRAIACPHRREVPTSDHPRGHVRPQIIGRGRSKMAQPLLHESPSCAKRCGISKTRIIRKNGAREKGGSAVNNRAGNDMGVSAAFIGFLELNHIRIILR